MKRLPVAGSSAPDLDAGEPVIVMRVNQIARLLLATVFCGPAFDATAQVADRPVFYLSPDGDDQRSGRSSEEAWQTLGRVQQALDNGAFAGGGEVRLARGGAFGGSLAINNLALPPGQALTIAAYGEGPAPVISGFVPLRNWEELGKGRWRAVCRECGTMPGAVTRDGVILPIARWPNLDEADHGYLYYQSAEGRTGITDERLSASPNWTGGEAVVRSAAWILDRLPIARHEGSILTFGTPATYAIPRGYGYFIQNHPAALDRDGEWVFDPAERTVTVFLEGTAPGDHQFAVAVTETLFSISGSQGVEIRDLRLTGARRANLEIRQSGRITVRGVESVQAGDVGMRCINCRELLIEDSSIDWAMNHGLDIFACTDCQIQRNEITNIATIAGMGRSGNGQYNGVRFGGENAVFRRNVVARTGYLGIDVRGAARIEQNVVREVNLVKTDGGGIYTWGNRDVDIVGNLVLNAAGSKAAVPWNSPATHGIYIDDQSEDVLVRGNTVVSVGSNGIFLHNTRAVAVERNTIVAGGEAQIAYIDDQLGTYTVSETAVHDNIFVNTEPGALMARASTNAGPEFFPAIGSMSGNRYCSPFAEPVFGSSLPAQTRLYLGQWQQLTGTDKDAQLCPQRYPLYQVSGVAGEDRVPNGKFETDIRGWFGWPGDALEAAWDSGRLRLRHTGSAPIIHYDAPIGLIERGRFYRVRFDAQSDQPGRTLRVYLRKWDPDYRLLGAAADFPIDNRSRPYELIVPATETEARSLLIFELPNASKVVWLDNVQLEPVNAQALNRSELVRVEVNDSAEPRGFALEEERTDVTGRILPAGSWVTVDPFGAVVLFGRTQSNTAPGLAGRK